MQCEASAVLTLLLLPTLPASHKTHDDWPCAIWYLPRGQPLHEALFTISLYLPAAQGVHRRSLSTLGVTNSYLPATHRVWRAQKLRPASS